MVHVDLIVEDRKTFVVEQNNLKSDTTQSPGNSSRIATRAVVTCILVTPWYVKAQDDEGLSESGKLSMTSMVLFCSLV